MASTFVSKARSKLEQKPKPEKEKKTTAKEPKPSPEKPNRAAEAKEKVSVKYGIGWHSSPPLDGGFYLTCLWSGLFPPRQPHRRGKYKNKHRIGE